MNILFIGPYRQTDGWGEAARAYALALKATGHTICLRPIYMAGVAGVTNLQPELLDMETNPHYKKEKYDVIIQNVLPHLLEYPTAKADKHIVLCVFETADLEETLWPRHINKMDELWVPSLREKTDITNSGVTIPVYVVPEPTDVEKFDKVHAPNQWKNLGLHDIFTFYFIGEFVPRKNLEALIIAFHREFDINEPVDLVIKTNKGGHTKNQTIKLLQDKILHIKKALGLYVNTERYKKEWVITEYLSEDILYSLHQACDCFVMPSKGEACCRPLMDAQGFGNTAIVTDNTGMLTYVCQPESQIVPSKRVPVVSDERPIPFLYTANETWSEIDIVELQGAMRRAYDLNNNPLAKAQRKSTLKSKMAKYSYDEIAKCMEEIL